MNEMSNNQKRLSNIELLRIISMLLVVTLHFLGRGGVNDSTILFSAEYFMANVWDAVAIVSVDLFVLISGYFLINSKFKPQKLIDIVVQVLTYSVSLYIICILLGIVEFSLSSFVKAFFPILTNQYWFATAYVALYIIFPFLNAGIHALTQKQHRNLCIILGMSLTLYLPSKALGENGTSVVWFICLYVFAAYLRLHYTPQNKVPIKAIVIYLISTAALPLSRYAISILAMMTTEQLLTYSKWFYKYNSIFVTVAAISLFIIFLNINIKGNRLNRLIGIVSPLTFGVYLIHNNPSIREFMWNAIDLPGMMNKLNIGVFVLCGIGIICGIFCICAGIEFIRLYIYKKIICTKFYKKIYNKISEIQNLHLIDKIFPG